MKTTKSIAIAAFAATALTSALGYAAVRGTEIGADQAALARASISLAQAISAAEQHAGGKAVRAELEDENGTYVYGVEVINGAQAFDVKVDSNTGAIVSSQADTDDQADAADEGANEHQGEQHED